MYRKNAVVKQKIDEECESYDNKKPKALSPEVQDVKPEEDDDKSFLDTEEGVHPPALEYLKDLGETPTL